MEKVGISGTGLLSVLSLPEAYRMIREAGFDAVDANINRALPSKLIKAGTLFEKFSSEGELLDCVRPFGDAAKEYGLEHYQSHAPFPVWCGDPAADEKMPEVTRWFIHAADAIDCRRLVVHPVRGYRAAPLTAREAEDKTMEFMAELIPAAKEYGVTVCLENMFAGHIINRVNKLFASTCADAEQVCRMVDGLNALAGQECFGFCLDTGHLLLVGQDIREFLPKLGHRLKALHVHDNNTLIDQHVAPYMGAQDWEWFEDAVAQSDFDGVLNFEISGVWDIVHPDLWPQTLGWIAQCGRMMARHITEKRSNL